jgi:hypothetical protein
LDIFSDVLAVGFGLLREGLAGFAEFVVLVDALDGLLEADGDEKTDDDGGDVDEEVAPGVCSAEAGVGCAGQTQALKPDWVAWVIAQP